ncbi:hypothetical protein JCM8547_001473 [Rhodosporidiobolus lusitaniae]
MGRTKKQQEGTGAGQGTRKSWREKLPGMLKGPLNALSPHIPPSPLYPSSDPLPSFLTGAAHRTAWKNRKLLLRAMVVLLTTLILVLNPDSLTVLGQASFFGMIVSVMLPPTFPAQVFLLVATTLVLGMCMGWAWGCAAMAAALRARDRILLASSLQRVQAGIAGATNPDVEYRTAIFRGEFLDARSTVVFGVFLWIGLFALGLLRAASPKAMLIAIFASIVMDVMCSYGPLFPFSQYTLATTFLIPTACFIAIAIAANTLIFPSSLNYSWTTDLVDKVLSPILQRSHLHSKLLSTPPPIFHDVTERPNDSSSPPTSPWSIFIPVFLTTQEATSAGLEGLLGSIGMLELEVSFGRLSSKDLAGLVNSLRELHVRSVGLGVLFNTVQSRFKRYIALQHSTTDSSSTSSSSEKPTYRPTDTARIKRARKHLGAAEHANQHDLASLLPIFDTASADLRLAAESALEGSMAWLIEQNKSRWSGKGASEETKRAQHEQVEQLEEAVRAYRTEGRTALVEPFRDLFDRKTGELRACHPRDIPEGAPSDEDGALVFSPGSLFTLLAASDNLVLFAEAVLSFVKKVDDLREKRTRNKLWWPTSLRKVGKLFKGGKRTNAATSDGEDPDRVDEVGEVEDSEDEGTLRGDEEDEDGGEKQNKKKGKKAKKDKKAVEHDEGRNPDARPPKNAFQRFTFALYRLLHFFTTPNAIFALKYATFSICIWLPQIFPSTSYLMYSEKSLWALIMFQTGLGVYAGDQILGSLQKLTGTAVGLVYGMLVWYIGAARGPGSPYGIGAAVIVFMLPAMAIRIFAPPASAQMAIQGAVTTILIVGYSWQDTHLASVGNPGVGYTLAWKRALLVMIGTGIAAVAMLLPPVSTRLLVRRTHATCMQELGKLYTTIISAWLREEQQEHGKNGTASSDEKEPNALSTSFSPAAQKAARARMLAVRVKLNTTRPAIEQSTYEISLRGDYPEDEYLQLLGLQLQLLQALAQLGQALVRLAPEWRKALVRETAFLTQPLIADVTTTFSLLSLALRQGSPLPQATPGPLLDRLLYHDRRLRLLSSPVPSPSSPPSSSSDAGETELEGARLSSAPLTFDVLSDERFGTYASALQALASVLLDLDETEAVVKRLVGETRFPGYEGLRERV